MIHSLYSHKDIFLRELISNASDAVDKARYEALTDSSLLEKGEEWKIRISADKKAGTLTVSDNGIGMTREEAVQALGTIAHSGTKEFLKLLQSKEVKDNPELIGQFGVGFYSSFMVADRVTVVSRKAGTQGTAAVKWESSADGSFTVDETEKEGKGTDIIVHLKEEEKKYLDEWEIRSIVKKYSDFIEYPIVMEVEREKESELKKGEKYTAKEEETLNSMKALWLRDKGEITEAEYNEFYKHVSHDFGDPARVIHYKAEGTTEFTALLYVPGKAPLDIFFKEYKIGPALYVRKVQIMDHCEEMVPLYLRFVKGVVDSSDLPLNVSREILQKNRQVEIIRKNITKKVLDTLKEMKEKDFDKYLAFYKEFGRVLKEGIHYDYERREAIADLLLFESIHGTEGSYTTFSEYVGSMKEGQSEIYYITGPSRAALEGSPYLEAFREKGYNVLIMTDDIDDMIFGGLGEYKGKKLKSVVKGDIVLDKAEEKEKKEAEKKFGKLLDLIKDRLKDDVKEVRFSGRLKDSAVCLVADEGDLDPNMERLLKAMGQEVPERKRILEMNPSHPLVALMQAIFEKDVRDPVLGEYADLLYDQALILEGSKPKDPAAFTKAVAKLMVEKRDEKA